MFSFYPNVKVKFARGEQNKYINSGIASTNYTLNIVLRVTQYHPGHVKSPVFLQQGYLTLCASFSCQRRRITLCWYRSNCGQPIPEKRLEALPWATLCVTCEPEPGSEG